MELAGAEAGAEALIAGATEEEAEAAAEAARSAAREEEQNRWVLMTLDGDVEPLGPPPAWAAHVDPLALERGSPLLQRLYRFLGAFSGGEEDPWLADEETGDVSLGFPHAELAALTVHPSAVGHVIHVGWCGRFLCQVGLWCNRPGGWYRCRYCCSRCWCAGSAVVVC